MVQNLEVTKLVDERNHKKTFFVITTDENTYHIIVEANITTIGTETFIDLSATLFNPENETITATARIPDTLTDAPYYSGAVEAFRLHLEAWVVTALKILLPIVIVVALIIQVIDIIEDYIEHPVLETLKTLLFGGPFIYASLPWVLLTLLQDTNQDGSFDMYVPYWPPSPHISLILQERYFIATNFNWWRISEQEVYTDIPIPFDGVWHIVWFKYFIAQWWRSRAQSRILPPTAEFIWRPNQPVVNETVTLISTSFAPNGTIAAYQWWLGDGGQRTDSNFAYAYHNSGNYNVTLKVTDNNGLTGNITHTIQVQPLAPAALRVVPDHLEVNVQAGQSATAEFLVGETLNQTDLLNVTFKAFDLSKTFENQTISSGNVTFNKNGITIAKGTYTNATATFQAPPDSAIGWYSGNVTVTSTNGGNSTIFADLFVYGPPTADFTWNPLKPRVGDLVNFDASSSIPGGGSLLDYEWNFGDGQTTSGQAPIHTYANASTYTVTLNVTDSNGLWDIEQKQVQVVQPHGPKADFTANPETANVGQVIKFDATGSQPGSNGTNIMPIAEYRWDFGDGNRTTTATAIVYHSFSTPGTYYPTLTVFAAGATPETDALVHRVTIILTPVGGYSVSLKGQNSASPSSLYLAILAMLSSTFTVTRRKARKKK
jgi:PKD repeat protein